MALNNATTAITVSIFSIKRNPSPMGRQAWLEKSTLSLPSDLLKEGIFFN
ncbi:MAG TPA: hypothetical protein VLD84_00430 [Nitrososphaeraceae archaeon]|nr:hypothetical protein [Nitrososphaeraceae archaeon]